MLLLSLSLSLLGPAASPPDSLAPPAYTMRRTWPVVAAHATPALVLFGYGLATRNSTRRINHWNLETREELREYLPRFRTSLDDYTRHAPVAAAFLLPLAGLKGHYNTTNFTLLFVGGYYLNMGLTSNLKRLVREQRPGSPEDYSSFPSAHTSQAFFTATLLRRQYPDQPIIGAAGYAVAAATGAMRMANDRHWLSDVAAGAGVGILSGEVMWHLYPLIQRRLVSPLARQLQIMPLVGPRATGLSIGYQPK